MKRYWVVIGWVITSLITSDALAAPEGSTLRNFITASGGKLFDGDKEFRFMSFNVPNLLVIEDNVGFTNANPWRLPDPFEITDALGTVRALGGTATRTYVITARRTNDTPEIPRHVLAPGKFDEVSFRALDEVLAAANRTGVRLIIPFVDNWPWMGGRAEYAGWRGKTSNDFWTDPQIIADFKDTVRFILTRTNTVTGVRYADDKAVLCWETGNELRGPSSWTRTIAAFIKSLDTNHLVMDGFDERIRPEVLEMPEVDIVTTHHYQSPGNPKTMAEQIRDNVKAVKGKKAYIVGEFGFVPAAQMIAAMDAIVEGGASGGLLWSLRFRNRDGGFYWHSEPAGDNLHKAFHWPPSRLGEPYDEPKLLQAARTRAFAIRGLSVPQPPVPAPPTLLPTLDAGALSWQGSVDAVSYEVERAAAGTGSWHTIATNIDEAFTQYRSQFADERAPAGKWQYRVRARNESGLSAPSNVQSIEVRSVTLVDELADLSRTSLHSGGWSISNRDSRAAKEDAHRAAGQPGDELVYELSSPIESIRVFAFFPKAPGDLQLSVSQDGKSFRDLMMSRENCYHGAGDYGYWQAVLFRAQSEHGGKFLKIRLTAPAQLGRVEITHAALSK